MSLGEGLCVLLSKGLIVTERFGCLLQMCFMLIVI